MSLDNEMCNLFKEMDNNTVPMPMPISKPIKMQCFSKFRLRRHRWPLGGKIFMYSNPGGGNH